jgi:hypothetical protein
MPFISHTAICNEDPGTQVAHTFRRDRRLFEVFERATDGSLSVMRRPFRGELAFPRVFAFLSIETARLAGAVAD